nr:MAG TPA: leucine-rich repeat protein [Caudoviricetes sp.]
MDYLTNDTDLKKVADAIRAKGNTTDSLAYPDEFVTAIGNIQAGGSSASESDITFYDYEGTIVESWTLAELATKTALPAYPSHEGLICQGWNWSLADLKSTNRKMNVGAMYVTDDGKTRIYIHLEEGRTSPRLCACPNGTVTVDWGDGTTPDTLTGTSTSTVKLTPTHNYAAPGDYVIKLTVDGEMGFADPSRVGGGSYSGILRYTRATDERNRAYVNTIKKVEIGGGITSIGKGAFAYCYSLVSVAIPAGITSIGDAPFANCYALPTITIPTGVTSVPNSMFSGCYALASVAIPASVTSIGSSAFNYCSALHTIPIPDSVTSIGNYAFSSCFAVAMIPIHAGITSIGRSAFNYCYTLSPFTIPPGVTVIADSMFNACYAFPSFSFSSGVTSIGAYAFSYCFSATYYDFTKCTSVPTLANTNAFGGITADCEIRVPAALVDEWKAATNWATYADHIVGV